MRRAKSVQRSRPIPKIPDTCPVCGQRIDKHNPGSIEHHKNPNRHLPYAGKKKRPGWA